MPALAENVPHPNPALLRWAREEGGFADTVVAGRLQVSLERLRAWESGERVPTVRQLQNLAKLYHRQLGLFFQEAPPREVPIQQEYRRLPSVEAGTESPELRWAIRQLSNRRTQSLELMEEIGYEIPEFTLSARLTEPPRTVGERIRAATGILVETQRGWSDGWQAWREWRNAVETLGALAFMFPDVSYQEARGLALPLFPLPVAAVNTKEVAEARAFTLLHEIVHLMLAKSKEESNALEDRHSAEEWLDIERFAEQAASYALIPADALSDSLSGRELPATVDAVRREARRWKVTPLAYATRLREQEFWTWATYKSWRKDWDAYCETLPPTKGGPVRPEQKSMGYSGLTFSRLVLEAYDTHRISSVEAARYLNLRHEYFPALREKVGQGLAAGGRDE